MIDPIDVARRRYQAYADSDRAAIEPLIAEDFHFTSPLDNRIDRATYFARCRPNNKRITGFAFIRILAEGEQVVVTDVARSDSGKHFRNLEVLTIRDGKVREAEVNFGWNVPHAAPAGGLVVS
ncbi:MAG: nuclear transport factor 2 family protein [Proteobacteria bacterium]|nr:nuclear transport factor 2 family protein [Pseudomonadota bacterium]